METEFVESTSELSDVIREFDDDSTIRGIGILVAETSAPDPEDIDPILNELSTQVFGGVFPQLIYRGETREVGAVVIGLRPETNVSVITGLSDPATRIEESLPATVPENGTAFVFVDAFATRVEDFVSSLFDAYGVTCNYLGGGAGSLEMEQRPCLFTNEGLLEDAAVLATVDAETSIGVRHGWERIAGPFRVTSADGQVIETLNEQPAFAIYREVVADDGDRTITEDDFFEVAKMYPFSISRLESEDIVRDPFEVTETGGIHCFGNVPEGEFVHILKGDRSSLVEAAQEAYADAAKETTGEVLFFDCISRVLYLEADFERELDAVGGQNSPIVGALTIGEVANDGKGHLDYYNKTAVAAIFNSL